MPTAQTLSVAAVYHLSEAGRKASLLAGGDGKAVQRLTLQVPATRLHLVVGRPNGVARLKLQPRFERVDGQGVVRRDGPPTYDAPPSIEDLFREAARNHELERAYQSSRSLSRDHRRDADRDRRLKLAEAFLTDPSQRAMVHPVPTPKRCFMATAGGRVMFDAATDVGPARDVPREAYRRFRADLRARKEQNLKLRAEHLALHEEKTRVIADWVAEHGIGGPARSARGRAAARRRSDRRADRRGVRALWRTCRAIRSTAPRVSRRICARVTGRANIASSAADLQVVGVDATAASAAQWAVVQQLQSRLPDADVTLREHRLSWRRDPALPGLTVFGVLVTRQVGPFILRREFAVPER